MEITKTLSQKAIDYKKNIAGKFMLVEGSKLRSRVAARNSASPARSTDTSRSSSTRTATPSCSTRTVSTKPGSCTASTWRWNA